MGVYLTPRSARFSLEPGWAAHLAKLLDQAVSFATDCIGEPAKGTPSSRAQAQGHNLVVLENVRFHKEEEKNDPGFAQQLAELADLYVNDAFGSSHRAHASTEGMAKLLPKAAAGFLMEDELKYSAARSSRRSGRFRGPRRCEGLRQKSRSSRTSSAASTPCSSAARWRTLVLQAKGLPVGNRWSTSTSWTRPAVS